VRAPDPDSDPDTDPDSLRTLCALRYADYDYDHDNDNKLNFVRFAVSNFDFLISNLSFYMSTCE